MILAMVPCASPSYIQENGAPQTPQDLVRHTCLTYLFSDRTHQQEWVFTRGGTTIPVQLKSRMRINDMLALINAAINGQGIVLAAEETLVDAPRRGDLVRVLSEYQGPSRPLNLVYKADSQQTAVVKAFVQEAVEHFTSNLSLLNQDSRL
jgi:DNA-binding transcriptional LysR family regulator